MTTQELIDKAEWWRQEFESHATDTDEDDDSGLELSANGCSDVSRLLFSLAAELKRVTEWRDISTAPKNGTGIQAWCPNYGVRELFWSDTEARTGWFLVGAPRESYAPTHWRELPKGPTT